LMAKMMISMRRRRTRREATVELRERRSRSKLSTCHIYRRLYLRFLL
jgi:hypothetical protein